jgi:uncharacterized protein YyaL (SSP411 family)
MFAATYGLASVLHARHPLQIVITGNAEDEAALELERTSALYYRFGRSVLRITPRPNYEIFPPALREILPGMHVEKSQAFICTAGMCLPPASDPKNLSELLAHIDGSTGTGAAAAS